MLCLRASIPLLLASATLIPALAPAQRLVTWGDNSYGQCTPYPAPVRGAVGGALHTMVLTESLHVGSFGDNRYHQCDAHPQNASLQISAGGSHSLSLLSTGGIEAWGNNTSGQCNVPTFLDYTQIAAGGSHSLGLRSNGTVVAFGLNDSGQRNVPAGLVATQIRAGGAFSMAMRANGTVAAWGDNSYGQCNVPAGLVATNISAGGNHCLALRANGSVVAWGDNLSGQSTVPNGLVAIQVAGGLYSSLALRPNGTVVAWGRNLEGECNVPAGLTGVLQIAAGGYHSLAIVAYAHCILDQTQIFSGGSATGTVKLALPSSSQTIALSCTDPRIHVPASVTLPQGTTAKTFPVTTEPIIGEDLNVTISTVVGGSPWQTQTVPFALKVTGAQAASEFSTASVVGGSTAKLKYTATLDLAQSVDTVLQVVNSNPNAVTLPATITIPAGQRTVEIPVPTHPISAPGVVTVQLKTPSGRIVATSTLSVNALKANVTLITPTLTGGESGSAGVYLSVASGETITIPLTSGDPSVTVPASVTVAAGARLGLFSITTSPTATALTVPITATLTGNPYSATLKVLAIPAIRSLTLPSSVFGNGKITGTVRLAISGRPGGTVVSLSSSDPALSVPATVTVPEGQYAATFVATSADGDETVSATVTASTATGSASTGVTVSPLSVASLTVSPMTAASGSTVTVTVALNTPVDVDTPVSLSSDNATLVPLPTTVTIPAGSRTATVTVTLGSTAVAKNVRITATKNASSLYRTLKVTP